MYSPGANRGLPKTRRDRDPGVTPRWSRCARIGTIRLMRCVLREVRDEDLAVLFEQWEDPVAARMAAFAAADHVDRDAFERRLSRLRADETVISRAIVGATPVRPQAATPVGGAAGSCTVTRSPPASRGVRVRVPSCAWVMLLTIARPRPTPAWSVRMRLVPRRNGSASVAANCGVSFSPVFSTVSTALLG